MPKRISTRHIKMHRAYEFSEAAELLSVTVQTIYTWRKNGLRVMTCKRPYLILGADLKAYVDKMQQEARRPLTFGTFYCLRCKRAQKPALGLIDYVPQSDTHGRLTALCAGCEGLCNRMIRKADLPAWGKKYQIGTSNA